MEQRKVEEATNAFKLQIILCSFGMVWAILWNAFSYGNMAGKQCPDEAVALSRFIGFFSIVETVIFLFLALISKHQSKNPMTNNRLYHVADIIKGFLLMINIALYIGLCVVYSKTKSLCNTLANIMLGYIIYMTLSIIVVLVLYLSIICLGDAIYAREEDGFEIDHYSHIIETIKIEPH